MSTAVVESKNQVAQRAVARPLIVAAVLEEESEQRKLLGEYISKHMQEGTDFGVIPGTERKNKDGSPAQSVKSLLKPGAEKLTALFRCIPRFIVEQQIEDWQTGLFYYRFRCQIITQAEEAVVAEGVGSCSSYESRYRWRNSERVCPECGVAAIKKSKFPPRNNPQAKPGWYCYDKAGGCGANFDADAEAIVSQVPGRVQNPDLIDSANTVLKMAKKRAHVDAAITLARCSDIFSQDIEDMPNQDDTPKPAKATPTMATTEQVSTINAHLKTLGFKWSKGIIAQTGEIIGRPLADNAQPTDLTTAEADTVIAELVITIQKKNTKPDVVEPEVVEPEEVNELSETNQPATEPTPAKASTSATSGSLPSVTQKAVLDALHELELGWHNEKAKARCSEIIGRAIAPQDHVSTLSIDEANKLIAAFKEAIAKKKAKAAAAAAKKEAKAGVA